MLWDMLIDLLLGLRSASYRLIAASGVGGEGRTLESDAFLAEMVKTKEILHVQKDALDSDRCFVVGIVVMIDARLCCLS